MKMKRFADVVPSLCLGLVVATSAANAGLANGLTLTSGEFKDGDYLANEQVLAGFGCEGQNRSPSLSWSDAPAGTKSFVLTAYDPDAPTGSGWWHWVVVNLPATTTSLPKGAGTADGAKLPEGALQVSTDFGAPGYGGPCPPEGDHPHRYLFTIHALDLEKLDVTADSSPALVGFYLHFHTLAEDSLMGLYKR
jgi:Raf kinase inhibitor-like YbhB/YbcL family protein